MTSVAEVKTNPSLAVIDQTAARELTPSTSPSFSFPVGYYDLHPDISINFQLNRFYGWVGDDSMLTEMREATAGVAGVDDYPTFTKTFLDLGDKALARHETLKGAYYLRLAEFFLFTGDPRKLPTRQRFVDVILVHFQIPSSACSRRARLSYSADSIVTSRNGCPQRWSFATPATTRSYSRAPAREQRSNWRTSP
jgi:hypothetical protein